MSDIIIKIDNLKKRYRLGAIGGTTLNAELQSWWAKKRGKEDPNSRIGKDVYDPNEAFWALKGINLEVRKGEALGIIGTNGAGKSTLLKILSRVTAPTEGDIWINGRISSMLEVGTGFHAELTGRENIYMNGAILGMSKREVDAKMEDIIEFSECRKFIDTPVKRYSSGMYVKLAFAVAASLDSEILIMDEVLAVGDMKFQKKCLGKMSDVAANEGRTILYVSHNMSTIRNLCTRCVVLDHGKIIFDGDVEEAIAAYMESNHGKLKNNYCFDNGKRASELFGTRVCIHKFEFLDTLEPRYRIFDKMKFGINWEGMDNIDDLRLRIEIRYADSTIAGMTESKPYGNARTGVTKSNTFQFDVSNLAEGTYYFRLSIFILNEFRVHLALDESTDPIYFEVIDDVKDRTRWLRQYWGSIRLNDIEFDEN